MAVNSRHQAIGEWLDCDVELDIVERVVPWVDAARSLCEMASQGLDRSLSRA